MEATSNIENYLQYLLSNEGELPKPSSRVDEYLHYLALGGNKDELPIPQSRLDLYLYYLCEKGLGGDGNTQVGPIGITVSEIKTKFHWEPPVHYYLTSIIEKKIPKVEGIILSTIIQKEKEGI